MTIALTLLLVVVTITLFSKNAAMYCAHVLNTIFRLPHPGPNDAQGSCWCRRHEKKRTLTKREKAIALVMLKRGYLTKKGTFAGDALIDSEDKMVFNIDYVDDSGQLEDLILKAQDKIDSVEETSNLS